MRLPVRLRNGPGELPRGNSPLLLQEYCGIEFALFVVARIGLDHAESSPQTVTLGGVIAS
jgi:hypothetical protein